MTRDIVLDIFLTVKNPQEKSRIRVSGLSVTTNLPGLKIDYLCKP